MRFRRVLQQARGDQGPRNEGLTVTRKAGEVRVDVVADAFCHLMVRALDGSLLTVGERRTPGQAR